MTFFGANLSQPRSTVFVAIGSNLDHPIMHVQRALRDIDELPETALAQVSTLYETNPVGGRDQPQFVNAVARIETLLSPHDFLARLHAIEAQHGRHRNSISEEKNEPRTLDLDILMFNDSQISERGLTVPHPRMHERAEIHEVHDRHHDHGRECGLRHVIKKRREKKQCHEDEHAGDD